MNLLAASLKALASALERLHIPYVIGGSIASSARGIVRSTYDVDVVAAISMRHADQLARELGSDWYAEPEHMKRAMAAHRAFNVIHMTLGIKADIFPVTDEFHHSQLQRAVRMSLPFLDDPTQYPVATAEDILLAKLRWYRDGGEISEVQWRDIAGIVVANPSLEMDYLNCWAASLGVTDLLARALKGTS
jgi:hypothetical protein